MGLLLQYTSPCLCSVYMCIVYLNIYLLLETILYVISHNLQEKRVKLSKYLPLYIYHTFNKLWKCSKENETLAYSSHDAMLDEERGDDCCEHN